MDYTGQLQEIIDHLSILIDVFYAIGTILAAIMYTSALGAAAVLFIVTLYAARNKSIWAILLVTFTATTARADYDYTFEMTCGDETYYAYCASGIYKVSGTDENNYPYIIEISQAELFAAMDSCGYGNSIDKLRIASNCSGNCGIYESYAAAWGYTCADVYTASNFACSCTDPPDPGSGPGCPPIDDSIAGNACFDGDNNEGTWTVVVVDGCDTLVCIPNGGDPDPDPEDCVDENGDSTVDPDDLEGTACVVELRNCEGELQQYQGTYEISTSEEDCGEGVDDCGCLVCETEELNCDDCPEDDPDCEECENELEQRFTDFVDDLKDTLGLDSPPGQIEAIDLGIAITIANIDGLDDLDWNGVFNFNNLNQTGSSPRSPLENSVRDYVETSRQNIRIFLTACVYLYGALQLLTIFARMW